ncbi:AAA family ATPase [uncultured Trichococcus sp.]|uniref:AAA family ATPase n=1 Tax=uncultured Trichococcus sp. TaxID=189665 RepID=UPI0029C634E8|nr:ATP-binding protein [uncultured Trichococcus sp.]
MNFKIQSIEIYNLRSFTSNDPLTIDLKEHMITIFDGPNGYGKTTFFDAIELLLTGELGHFFSSLYNRGSESLSSVAKNIEEDTVIIAEVNVKDKGVYCLKRIFNWASYNDTKASTIEMTSQGEAESRRIRQEELFEFFGFSASVFNVGMYISQNDSLQFLKLPYKKRKDTFSAITGTEGDEANEQYLGEVRTLLIGKKKEMTANFDNRIKAVEQKIADYTKLVNTENEEFPKITYKRLFLDKKFDFDVEIVDITKIERYLHSLSQIEKYISNQIDFINYKNNEKISNIYKYDKKFYEAVFYEEKVSNLKRRQKEISQLKQFESIKQLFSANAEVQYENELFDSVFKDSLQIINDFNLIVQSKEKNLSGKNLQKNKLIAARNNLKNVHEDDHYLDEDVCPYCGRAENSLLELYVELSKTISENESDLSKEINKQRELRDQFILEHFVPEIDSHVASHLTLVKEFEQFSGLFGINTEQFEEVYDGLALSVNLRDNQRPFKEVYPIIMEEIQKKLLPLKSELTTTDIVEFSTISQQYFDNQVSLISSKDILDKKEYLVQTRNNQGRMLKSIEEKYKQELESQKDSAENRCQATIDEITHLRSVYNQCIHEYNTDFLEDIKVPLFIISGRIMQTSPMGLGIEAKIDDRRIEFISGEINHDVVNMLSAGQLNGLMISIMLAVQKTYLSNKGVKLFMIDDPLQSIDDLSAHSFVDLLTQEFRDNQIFISTHELDKTAMFYYKYNQAGIPFSRKNLQLEYLK